jgi:acylpyruvate hydrolase
MKLATIRLADGRTAAVRVDGETLVELGHADVGAVLATPGAFEAAGGSQGTRHDAATAQYATLVSNPGKTFCVGLNYRNHIQEMGRELPTYPTLFAKFADSLIGATDDIARPHETDQFDWEAELVIVIGRTVRRATEADAAAAIAGFSVANDITCRDWQTRTMEWLQGKCWDSSTPVGPWHADPAVGRRTRHHVPLVRLLAEGHRQRHHGRARRQSAHRGHPAVGNGQSLAGQAR